MTVKTIQLQDGRAFHFGRRRPPVRMPVLSLKNYIDLKSLPPPPTSVDYTPDAATVLSRMYLNDKLGDCVVAAIGHTVGVLVGNEPTAPPIFTDSQIEAIYSGACGYVPGNSNTDQGCDIQTTLSYWQQHGAPIGTPHKNVGWVAVDPTNKTEVMTALWLFENLIPGIELPDAWVNPGPNGSGFVWGVAGPPDPQNGHCPPFFGYTTQGVITSTWGMVGITTWAAVAKYCAASAGGELYAVFSQDQINAASQKAPNGFNLAALVADFNALGGNIQPPAPPPPPTPPSNVIVVQGELISQQPVPGHRHEHIYTILGTLVSHHSSRPGFR